MGRWPLVLLPLDLQETDMGWSQSETFHAKPSSLKSFCKVFANELALYLCYTIYQADPGGSRMVDHSHITIIVITAWEETKRLSTDCTL